MRLLDFEIKCMRETIVRISEGKKSLRKGVVEHARSASTQQAAVTEDTATSLGERLDFRQSILASLASWIRASVMVEHKVKDFDLPTWTRLMEKETTYADSAVLLLVADLKRVTVLVESVRSNGSRCGGRPHVFRPRQGVAPRAVVRLLCHVDTHFVLIAREAISPAQIVGFAKESWASLSDYEQKAARTLRFSPASWTLRLVHPELRVRYDRLNRDQRRAAGALGTREPLGTPGRVWRDANWIKLMSRTRFRGS